MADRRNPLTMTDDQLVAEIRAVRGEIEERSHRLAELARGLYASARRRDVRREFERLGDELHSAETAIRTANEEQRPAIEDAIIRLRAARTAQQERISSYTAFSNTWIRFAGMIGQALQRTRSTDRILSRLPIRDEPPTMPGRRVQEPPEEALQTPPEEPEEGVPTRSPMEDLIEMYGEETPSDA